MMNALVGTVLCSLGIVLSLTELFIPFFYSMEQMTPEALVFDFYSLHSRRPPARGVVESVIPFMIHSPYNSIWQKFSVSFSSKMFYASVTDFL